jgi:hypothetical protein
MNSDSLVQRIATIPPGKTLAMRTHDTYASVRKTAIGYEVECGWRVNEAHDDDYESYSYHPLKGGQPAPWCGRRYRTDDASAAAMIYDTWKRAVGNRQYPRVGEIIGSVVRTRTA